METVNSQQKQRAGEFLCDDLAATFDQIKRPFESFLGNLERLNHDIRTLEGILDESGVKFRIELQYHVGRWDHDPNGNHANEYIRDIDIIAWREYKNGVWRLMWERSREAGWRDEHSGDIDVTEWNALEEKPLGELDIRSRLSAGRHLKQFIKQAGTELEFLTTPEDPKFNAPPPPPPDWV